MLIFLCVKKTLRLLFIRFSIFNSGYYLDSFFLALFFFFIALVVVVLSVCRRAVLNVA